MYPVNSRREINVMPFHHASSSVFKIYNEGRRNNPKFTDIDVESQSQDNLTEIVKKNFQDYCDQSSIHGLKYIGQRKRIEKFLWTLICVFLLGGCGTQIYQIVGKWRQNPLIFLLDTKMSLIQEIDFPAVTICPQRLPNRNRFNYTGFLHRFLNDEDLTFTDDEIKLFDVVSKVCHRHLLKYMSKVLLHTNEIPTYNNSELFDILDEYFLFSTLILPFCDGIVSKYKNWECTSRFTRIWLKEGLCYSFNMLPKDQIFRPGVEYPLADQPDLVFPKEEPAKTNAANAFTYLEDETSLYRSSSRRERLHVRTRAYEDFSDVTCKLDFFVFIHNPHEIPWDQQATGHLIQANDFVKNILTVTPSVVQTEENLRTAFTPEERGCYFEDERPLRFFQKYSQKNCELECMTNGSFYHTDRFSCAAYWMPRTPEIAYCHFTAYVFWATVEGRATDDLLACNCLPDCNSIEYSVTVSSSHTPLFDETPLKKEDAMDQKNTYAAIFQIVAAKKFFIGKNKDYKFDIPIHEAIKESNYSVDFDLYHWNFSEIEVHYGSSEFLAMKRHLAYSFADFVSQIGGILGCFLGISIFSIVEIIYFCTVKMMKGTKDKKEDDTIQTTRLSRIG